MTSSSEMQIVESAVVHGANDFIVKPVAANTLQEKLMKLYSPVKNTNWR